MHRLFLFNKPYRVLSQFSDTDGKLTLKNFISIKNIYPAGRLDFDSEGLLVLTDWGYLQHLISDPKHKLPKTYLVQVEGIPDKSDLNDFSKGILLKDGITKSADVDIIPTPLIPEREPPIRIRKNIPTSWLSVKLTEGRNRQVRRMTASIGYPTLRLIRISIGPWNLGTLNPGEIKEIKCPGNEIELNNIVLNNLFGSNPNLI